MDHDFDEIARVAAAEDSSAMNARIERERRVQTRARRVRSACRYVMLAAGLASVACLYFGSTFESKLVGGIGCFFILPTLVAGVCLFFMGGFAPSSVRRNMSQQQRSRLDR